MIKEQKKSREVRFWGWGMLGHSFDKDKARAFLEYLQKYYRLSELPDSFFELEDDAYVIPETRLPPKFVDRWIKKGLTLDNKERLIHSLGKSYRDLLRVRSARISHYADGVLHLLKKEDLTELYKDAGHFHITLIPFGGGTGVVGGTECIGVKNSPVLVVDLKKIDALLQLDKTAQTARFEAGILGPKLEETLNNKGFTLGHFPQSFEFSTLGGWVATRSAGQNSTKYGKIEDRVQSLTIVTPVGQITTNAVPSSATGPSIKQILIGSEGIYGIITDATLRISPLPEDQKFVPGFFKSFKDGIHCFREVMQEGTRPSVMRLSDPSETEMFIQIALTSPLKKRLMPYWMKYKKLGDAPCFFMIATEGSRDEVRYSDARVKHMIKKYGGAMLGPSLGDKWKKDRFELPYLRDDLMDHGFFIDTLETAAPWSQLQKIYFDMADAFVNQRGFKEKIVFGCHLSHCYSDGASLYFTFLGLQRKGQELKQWEEIKKIATDVIMENGGTLSHHHGIGYDHKRWMEQEKTPLGIEVLKSIKRELDPDGLLNPGKVV
ncbi:MAG: FAD-binding oxidoreductase [Deltaproteobacteria bacterium]|nr:FAD-binding oxidoreductase [Deltaproteobacteria bacterium]